MMSFSPSSIPQVGQPLVGCPLLLIHYIRSYLPYLEGEFYLLIGSIFHVNYHSFARRGVFEENYVSSSCKWVLHPTDINVTTFGLDTFHFLVLSKSGKYVRRWNIGRTDRQTVWYEFSFCTERIVIGYFAAHQYVLPLNHVTSSQID
jgi:hypothetical protein